MTVYEYLIDGLNLSTAQCEAIMKLADVCGLTPIMEARSLRAKGKQISDEKKKVQMNVANQTTSKVDPTETDEDVTPLFDEDEDEDTAAVDELLNVQNWNDGGFDDNGDSTGVFSPSLSSKKDVARVLDKDNSGSLKAFDDDRKSIFNSDNNSEYARALDLVNNINTAYALSEPSAANTAAADKLKLKECFDVISDAGANLDEYANKSTRVVSSGASSQMQGSVEFIVLKLLSSLKNKVKAIDSDENNPLRSSVLSEWRKFAEDFPNNKLSTELPFNEEDALDDSTIAKINDALSTTGSSSLLSERDRLKAFTRSRLQALREKHKNV